MYGTERIQGGNFSHVTLEQRVPHDHPLREVRRLTDVVLRSLSAEFDRLHSASGRPSIAPEYVLRALLLQTFYSVHSERQLIEQIDYNLLFRWFVGLGMDDSVWNQAAFSKDRDWLLTSEVAQHFFAGVLEQAKGFMSDDHFTIDDTLIHGWASPRSLRRKQAPDADVATSHGDLKVSGSRLTACHKVIVFHDNFAQMGGAERVAETIHATFPGANLGTTLFAPERLSDYSRAQHISTTWMQSLPAKARLFRWYFLLYPFAIEGVDLQGYDLILSSCFGYAKGLKRRPGAVHICYCHNPMRWVWRTSDYLEREKIRGWRRTLLLLLLRPLKSWEMRAATRPDYYIANSRAVAERLKTAFNVDSIVIPPPIDTSRFKISHEIGDYFLILSRLVPYKRLDLAVRACSLMQVRLLVIGDGPDMPRLQSMSGSCVEFLGRQQDEQVADLASRCRALLFPGEEDFGMTPLEVNAAGRPVIAFRGGGAVETVIPGLNGIFFEEPSVDSLVEALKAFERIDWEPARIRAHALGFDREVFQRRMVQFITDVLLQLHAGLPIETRLPAYAAEKFDTLKARS